MIYNVYRPIGLETFVSKIDSICANPEIYRHGLIKPKHYLLNLDAGNGQSTVTAFVSEAFQANKIRHFGGMDLYLEYKLDGTMQQLKQVLNDIRSSAVYTNEYEGIIAMDIEGFAAHLNESQLSIFLKELPILGKHATLILYVPSNINKNIASLIEKVCAALGDDLEVVSVDAYTEQNLVDIIKHFIDEAGISLDDSQAADTCIHGFIQSLNAATIQDAKKIGQLMIKHADFGSFVPVLSAKQLAEAYETLTIKEVK